MPTETFTALSEDGRVYNAGLNYSTVQSATTGIGTTKQLIEVGQNVIISTYFIYRAFLRFDTSSIPDGATITAAKLQLCCELDNSTTDFDVNVYEGTQADTIENADYDAFQTTLFGSWNTSNYIDETYIDINLNSSGLSAINKSGTTYYCLRSANDANTTAPANAEYVQFRATDDTTKEPKLEVTYTISTTSLTASISAQSSGNATVTITRTLTSSISAQSSGNATFTITRTLTSSISAQSSGNAIITITRTLTSSISAQASGTASMTVTSSGTVLFSATIVSQSSISGLLGKKSYRQIAVKIILSDNTNIEFYFDEVKNIVNANLQNVDLLTPIQEKPYLYRKSSMWQMVQIELIENHPETKDKIQQLNEHENTFTIYYAYAFFGANKSFTGVLLPDSYRKLYKFGEPAAKIVHTFVIYQSG